MQTKKLIYAKHVLLIIKTKDYTVIITSQCGKYFQKTKGKTLSTLTPLWKILDG